MSCDIRIDYEEKTNPGSEGRAHLSLKGFTVNGEPFENILSFTLELTASDEPRLHIELIPTSIVINRITSNLNIEPDNAKKV
jgi:hypothetical protein